MARKPTLLIDGDLILHRAGSAVETEVRWDDENHVLFSNEEDAWDIVQRGLDTLVRRFEGADYIVCLSQSPNFRLTVDPTYKGNRAKTRKPTCYPAVKKRLEETVRCVSFPGLEADDVMGIFATRDSNTIICSEDKDMQTIPCKLYAKGEMRVISEEEADRWHMYQTLIGDTSDGYKGCPGIGPKKAEALIQEAINAEAHKCGTMTHCVWPTVVATFEKAGLTEADALTQARLARILRSSDWDADAKQPILWTP